MAVRARRKPGSRWGRKAGLFRGGRYVLFSDISNNRIMRFSEDDGHVSVYRQPAMKLERQHHDREGRLITLKHSRPTGSTRTGNSNGAIHHHRRQVQRQEN